VLAEHQVPLTVEGLLLRFTAATLLTVAFGLARQKLGKPIGFGTFVFVSIGACALAITARERADENPLPLLGAIVTGVGFLGAGALFRTTDRIVGFTSAATIWVVAIFGLTVGVGEFLIAGILYIAIWIVILLDRWLELRSVGVHAHKLTLELSLKDGAAPPELASLGLKDPVATVFDLSAGLCTLTYQVSGRRETLRELERRLLSVERLNSYALE
jgi:putative Mg2+ transporter-C (MgtC) family protein